MYIYIYIYKKRDRNICIYKCMYVYSMYFICIRIHVYTMQTHLVLFANAANVFLVFVF